MVLFKITRGDSSQFLTKSIPPLKDGEEYVFEDGKKDVIKGVKPSVGETIEINPPFHDGFCYYVQNTGEFFIDSAIYDENENIKFALRAPINSRLTNIEKNADGTIILKNITLDRVEESDIGNYSSALGYQVIASGGQSFASGYKNQATGQASYAEGVETKATNIASHSEGAYTIASNQGSHAEGCESIAEGLYSHAEGGSIAISTRLVIQTIDDTKKIISVKPLEGYETDNYLTKLQVNDYLNFSSSNGVKILNKRKILDINYDNQIISFTEPLNENILINSNIYLVIPTKAQGNYSHVEGAGNIAQGAQSHVEGMQNKTLTTGIAAHAEGISTIASGAYSHSENADTEASGEASHAEGISTIASQKYQHVQGKFNIEDTLNEETGLGQYAHIVGNGEENAPSNAHTLDWEGNAWFKGDVYVGCLEDGVNKDEGSRKLATEYYVHYSNPLEATSSDGRTYNVTMGDENFDFSMIKPGFELTIIPNITSTITGPSLTINGIEATKTGMRVTAATTNSSFNGTRPDFINAGTPLKLMYIERNTVNAPAYAVLSNGTYVYMKNTGKEYNGYYIKVLSKTSFQLYNQNNVLQSNNLVDVSGISDFGLTGTYIFSNGTTEGQTYLWRIMNSVRINAEAIVSNNANGGGMYPSTPGKANEKLIWNTPAKVGADINFNSVLKATRSSGKNFVINAPHLTSLYDGLIITFIPNITSTYNNISLTINGADGNPLKNGAQTAIEVYVSTSENSKKSIAPGANYFQAGSPVTVRYDQGFWKTLDRNIANLDKVQGTLSIENGGTNASTVEEAKEQLDIPVVNIISTDDIDQGVSVNDFDGKPGDFVIVWDAS